MTNVTPEQRAEWRADAERVSGSSCCFNAGQPGHGPGEHRPFYDVRILALLDALDAAEAKVADAWDEGFEAGEDDAMYEERGTGPYPAYPHKNPYREQT